LAANTSALADSFPVPLDKGNEGSGNEIVSRLLSNRWSLERDTLSLAKGKICADENNMEALATLGRFATLVGQNILFNLLFDDHI